jgi:hypothetical protein
VRVPHYREQPGWRYVYIAAMFLAVGVVGILLFGMHDSFGWIAVGIGAVFGMRGLVDLRRA